MNQETAVMTPDSAPALPTGTSNSDFLPTGKEYRLKGELPSQKEDESAPSDEETAEVPAVKEDSAPSEPVTAAASGAAPTQKKLTAEQRREQLNREIRELTKKRDEARREASQPSVTPAPQPVETKPVVAASQEPQIGDESSPGKPKYNTFMEWQKDHDKWLRENLLTEFKNQTQQEQQERAKQQQQKAIVERANAHVEKGREKYDDFDEVALSPNLPLTPGSIADQIILDSDFGPDMVYQLGKNPAELERINKLPHIKQARELYRMEFKLEQENAPPASAPRVTQAPRPPHQVSGKGTVSKDAIDQAVEDNDTDTYMKEQNARVLARLKRK